MSSFSCFAGLSLSPLRRVSQPRCSRLRVLASSSPLQALQSFFTGKTDSQRAAKAALLAEIEGTERGFRSGTSTRRAVEAAVDALAVHSGQSNTSDARLSGCWRLLWTSERETLFLLRNGIPFVGPARESYQLIETRKGRLANVILFGEDSAFSVDASLAVESPTSCTFAFTGASLALPARTLRLAPFGAGSFDTVYVDGDLRVSRDSRGDTLVTERCAAPGEVRSLLEW